MLSSTVTTEMLMQVSLLPNCSVPDVLVKSAALAVYEPVVTTSQCM